MIARRENSFVRKVETLVNIEDVRKFRDENQNPILTKDTNDSIKNHKYNSSKLILENKNSKESKPSAIIDDKVLETSKQQKQSSKPNEKLLKSATVQEKCTIKKEISDHVGFSNHFSQKERRNRKDLSLNIIVLGEIGVGKTSFIRTLLADCENIKVSPHKSYTKYSSSLNLHNHKLNITVSEFKG